KDNVDMLLDIEEEISDNNVFLMLQNWSIESSNESTTILVDNFTKYLDDLNTTILTEENLTDEQIVQLVLEEEKDNSESDKLEIILESR
ncbi:2096_t:CDS:1, partial [Racocetra persica]